MHIKNQLYIHACKHVCTYRETTCSKPRCRVCHHGIYLYVHTEQLLLDCIHKPYTNICIVFIQAHKSTGSTGDITASCLRQKKIFTRVFIHRYLHTCIGTCFYLHTKKPQASKGLSCLLALRHHLHTKIKNKRLHK